jgi:integrase/recombinase XerD
MKISGRSEAMTMEGPLAPWAPGMAETLTALGYTPRLVERHLHLAGGLSKFLHRRGLAAADVEPGVIEQFVAALRAKNTSWRPTARSLSWLVDYLRQVGVATTADTPRERTGPQELIERYRDYLRVERGLEPVTIANYVRVVARFLAAQRGRELDELSAADVSEFMTSQCRQVSARQAERLATGLRSVLGFALVQGLISRPLTGAVPSVARWSGAGLPRGLTAPQIAALLAGCDRRKAMGRRDYAILVLLMRLGLRAAEVSALRLDDIDWRAGEIVIRGKGRTEERLPLPPDVGAAIAAYLRQDRPQRPEREVFLRVCAPLRGLTPDGVGEVVRAAGERAGLGSFGSHRLRHTAATQMLQAGASLPEVAQVLRHRSVATTVIYAKVDHRALRELATPWPGNLR